MSLRAFRVVPAKKVRALVVLALVVLISVAVGSAQASQSSQTATSTNTSAKATAPGQASNSSTSAPAVATYLNTSNKNAIKITLKVSRQQAVAGSDFGITAIVENTSANPIYFVPGAFSMTPPPEIDTEGPRDWLAFFPGILVPENQNYYDTVIVLEPGSNISAFWAGQRAAPVDAVSKAGIQSRTALAIQDVVRAITFSPGQYSLAIVGSYWDTHEGAQIKSVEHHTQTAEITETITAPEKVILLGAALGGMIAFLLLTRLYPSGAWSGIKPVTGFISAVLLSTIVTILLSRLSQSQFIVQVTVNDFWGAIAVGFLITAAGPPILQKFTALVQGSAQPTPAQPTPAQQESGAQPNTRAEIVTESRVEPTNSAANVPAGTQIADDLNGKEQ